VQKEFKDIFMCSDITEEETANMLNRYKNLEKIRIDKKVSKEDYIKAVFEKAKRKFGFEDCKFYLEFMQGEVSKAGKTMGKAYDTCDRVGIDLSQKIEKIQGTIHHEMRHMKQHYYAVNYDPQAYIKAMTNKNSLAKNLKEDDLQPVLDSLLDTIKDSFNLKSFSKNNVPAKLREYTKKCLEAKSCYADGHANYDQYYESFLEQDARYAESKISKLFGLNKKD
jgi:hypothetical protein